jgi:GNAT superfamily N-acetyltransferase
VNEPTQALPDAPSDSEPKRCEVRQASADDVEAVAAAIEELLEELGGERPSTSQLEEAAWQLTEGTELGALFVAEADGEIVGVLAASWQHAIHVPGRYGTIQDLWVHRKWRNRAIGRDLVDALVALAGELDVPRLEVGLPSEDFPKLAATRRFYLANGFNPLGPRMRRLLQ